MKIVIAPDKFKGSLSAPEVCDAIECGVRRVLPKANIVKVPLADGGEGTVQALVTAAHGRFITRRVIGPLGEKVTAKFGLIDRGKTAVIEMAAASGLELVPKAKQNPLRTTTFGTGELISMALQLGVKKIILGIGGSATNDGGAGMAMALGIRLLDDRGESIGFGGGALSKLSRIDLTESQFSLFAVPVSVACDVKNPLCGPRGASAVYGPQKGASLKDVKVLDRNLLHYSKIVERDVLKSREVVSRNQSLRELPGTGAAGGLGYGLCAFLNGRLERGIDLVLDHLDFRKIIEGVDLVITGEGSVDEQTSHGKVPMGVAIRAKSLGIPVVALGGSVPPSANVIFDNGIDGVMSICHSPMTLEAAFKNARPLLELASERIMRLLLFKWNAMVLCSGNRLKTA